VEAATADIQTSLTSSTAVSSVCLLYGNGNSGPPHFSGDRAGQERLLPESQEALGTTLRNRLIDAWSVMRRDLQGVNELRFEKLGRNLHLLMLELSGRPGQLYY
jgi:hypothetical protein